MKKTIGLLALLAAPALGVAQDGPRAISLAEALDMARRNAPSMISARGQLRTSAMALRQAKWAFSPLNNIELSYSSSTGGGGSYVDGILIPRAATEWSFSQGFGGISVPLWDGGQRLATVRQRGAQVNQAQVNETSQSYTVASQVKTQYYNVLRQLEQLSTAEQQLKNAEFQMGLAQARVRAGAAIIADTLQSMITVLQAHNSILNAKNALRNANAQLTRLTAAPFEVTAMVSDTADLPPLSIPEAELYVLAEQGPAVRTSEAQLAVSRAQEKSAAAILWPTITASGGFGRSNRDEKYDFGQGDMNYNWNFSLSARYTLWNNFGREAQILGAKVSADNAEASLRESRLTARQNMTQQLGQLRTNEAQIVLLRAQLVAAEENLRVIQRRYELGAGTLLELTTAQQQVTSTRASLSSSRFDVRTARAAIEALIGRDLPQ